MMIKNIINKARLLDFNRYKTSENRRKRRFLKQGKKYVKKGYSFALLDLI